VLARPITANIATNTQNEEAAPAMARAAEPKSSPPIRLPRGPVRSTKKPTGVCDTAETTLKAVSARLSSV
jgi:hypothetical protein